MNVTTGLVITSLLAVFLGLLVTFEGAKPKHWGKALTRVLIVWAIGNSPMLLLALESWLHPDLTFNQLFDSNIRFGEAIVYVAAILSPVLYTVIFHLRETAKIYVFTNVIGVLACIAIGAFVYARHLTDQPVVDSNLVSVTFAIYILSILFWYFSLVYEYVISDQSPGSSSRRRSANISGSLP